MMNWDAHKGNNYLASGKRNPLADPQKQTLSRAWLITFTDLISLLLTFFVLMFSMSNIKTDDWTFLTDTLSRSLSPVTNEQQSQMTSSNYNISTLVEREASNLDYLASVINELSSKDELLKNSKLTIYEDRIVIGLPGNVMFKTDEASITPQAKEALFALGSILRNVDNRIGINGYSSSVLKGKGNNTNYTSDWELSIARAAAVSIYFHNSGIEQDITAYGFANTRYNNQDKEAAIQNELMADRVDIVVFLAASTQ
jgi:chemotaxis protein MotB